MNLFIVLFPQPSYCLPFGRQSSVTFRAITAVTMRVTAFWHMTSCGFEGTLFAVKMDAASPNTLIRGGRLGGVCVLTVRF